MFPADYELDDVDQASDAVQTASAGYPMVTFKYSPTGVFAAMRAEDARNTEKREAFIHAYDLMEQFTSADVPQFIHYGTKDMLIPPALIEEYVQCAKNHGCDITTLALEGANHGYGADPKGKKTIQWIEAYANWLKTKSQ